MHGIWIFLASIGVAAFVIVLWNETWKITSKERAAKRMNAVWPWFIGMAILFVGLIGLESGLEGGNPLRLVATAVFVSASSVLFVWWLRERARR